MVRTYNFAVLQLPSHPARGEVINIALAVGGDNGVEVFCPRPDKIRALTAALDPEEIREDAFSIIEPTTCALQSGRNFKDALSDALTFSTLRISAPGTFQANSTGQFQNQVDRLLQALVVPEPSPPKGVRKGNAKLKSSIRQAFSKERIIATGDDTIEDHRVVYNHKIDDGIVVDFLLKNSAFYIMEAVDMSADTASLSKAVRDIAMSALTFEHARMKFSESGVKPKLVYHASAQIEKMISSSLIAAEHQGAQIINWDSMDDKRSLLVEISNHAVPKRKKTDPISFHASIQRKLDLN